MWIPLKEKEKKIKIKKVVHGTDGERQRTNWRENCFLFIFFLFVSFSDLRKSDRRNSSGQERKVFYETRVTRGYQKHRFSPRIQVKIRKILFFGFSQIYDVITVRIFWTKS